MSHEVEIWKDIKGFEGCYQVSNLGRVKSLERIADTVIKGVLQTFKVHERILRPGLCQGYPTVGLHKNGIKKNQKVHRLVALAFIPGYDPLKYVNHIDENKKNAHCKNLEWLTPSENAIHSMAARKRGARYGSRHYNSKLVLNLNTGIFYDCVREAAFVIDINYKTLVSMLNGSMINRTPFIYA